MNIKEAAERTGLTKKAIKYYEAEALVNPKKNTVNNYRVYSDKDIARLNLIAAMRLIDIPIYQIKQVIQEEKPISQVARDFKAVVDERLRTLEQSQIILSELIDEEIEDHAIFESQINRLKDALELTQKEKSELVANTLLKIFPGGFGKLMVWVNQPFFNFKIETKEEEEIWLDFVDYLDSLEEPDPDHPFLQLFTNNEEALHLYLEQRSQEVKKILSGDSNMLKKLKASCKEFMQAYKDNQEFREEYHRNLDKSQDLFNTIGNQEREFDYYLARLNEDYRLYKAIYQGIIKEVEDELGYSFDELLNPDN